MQSKIHTFTGGTKKSALPIHSSHTLGAVEDERARPPAAERQLKIAQFAGECVYFSRAVIQFFSSRFIFRTRVQLGKRRRDAAAVAAAAAAAPPAQADVRCKKQRKWMVERLAMTSMETSAMQAAACPALGLHAEGARPPFKKRPPAGSIAVCLPACLHTLLRPCAARCRLGSSLAVHFHE
jgi:hypothetical protein